jgi:hypothetical protein
MRPPFRKPAPKLGGWSHDYPTDSSGARARLWAAPQDSNYSRWVRRVNVGTAASGLKAEGLASDPGAPPGTGRNTRLSTPGASAREIDRDVKR